ncbi:MAG: RnfABCDGE type electron transport complex subunit G [Clostridium sp.]|nr:RnfABCDGE type electron transport complex subunit G [Clostridium sp.]
MLKNTLILFIITLIAGVSLSLVYSVTKEPIREQEEAAKQKAYQAVFADAERFEEEEDFDPEMAAKLLHGANTGSYADDEIQMLAAALDQDGNVLGSVITVTTHAGFGGDITFAMGIRADGTLTGVSITAISETPGLGMRASEVLEPQFKEKQTDTPFAVTKAGATYPFEIDAISSATITSQALTDAVNAGVAFLQAWTDYLEGPAMQGGVELELGGGADDE